MMGPPGEDPMLPNQGMDGRRANAPRFLDIGSATRYGAFLRCWDVCFAETNVHGTNSTEYATALPRVRFCIVVAAFPVLAEVSRVKRPGVAGQVSQHYADEPDRWNCVFAYEPN